MTDDLHTQLREDIAEALRRNDYMNPGQTILEALEPLIAVVEAMEEGHACMYDWSDPPKKVCSICAALANLHPRESQ